MFASNITDKEVEYLSDWDEAIEMNKEREVADSKLDFIIKARQDGLNNTTAELCYLYLTIRGFDLEFSAEWIRRFSKGNEWSNSDYAGRRTLQRICDVYPTDLDACFH